MDEIRRGSRAACELLFERYRDPVWRFFRRGVPGAGGAGGLGQGVFVAGVGGAGRGKKTGAVRSVPFRLPSHMLFPGAPHAPRPAAPPPPSRHATDPDAAIWVRDAMNTLDEADREILMLREYEELSYQEIADVRGTPLNTVRSQLFRARMALKAALETRTSE